MIAIVGPLELQQAGLRAFHRLGREGRVSAWEPAGHRDGWGIVAHGPTGPVHVARSAGDVERERAEYTAAVDALPVSASSLVMAHFRKSTHGHVHIDNAHPFCVQEWALTHNGTVLDLECLGAVETHGTTDSEALLRHWVAANHPLSEFPRFLERVAQRCRFSSLTTLLSNRSQLLAYRRVARNALHPLPSGVDPYQHYQQRFSLLHWQDGANHMICSEMLPEVSGSWTEIAEESPLIISLL